MKKTMKTRPDTDTTTPAEAGSIGHDTAAPPAFTPRTIADVLSDPTHVDGTDSRLSDAWRTYLAHMLSEDQSTPQRMQAMLDAADTLGIARETSGGHAKVISAYHAARAAAATLPELDAAMRAANAAALASKTERNRILDEQDRIVRDREREAILATARLSDATSAADKAERTRDAFPYLFLRDYPCPFTPTGRKALRERLDEFEREKDHAVRARNDGEVIRLNREIEKLQSILAGF